MTARLREDVSYLSLSGSGTGIVYIVNKAFSLFNDVLVDNAALTLDRDYTAVESSIKITLLPAYLDTLTAGTHTLRVNFKDNTYATTTFTVAAAVVEGQKPENPNTGADIPFEDVKDSDWFVNGVMYAYEKGLMTGTSTSPMLFSPNTTTTRGMIVTILYRMESGPDVSALANPFDDVAAGQWYTDAIKWAADNGIVGGIGGGKFAPDTAITRQDLAVILLRYMTFKEINIPVTQQFIIFADEADISDYAMDAVQTLNKLGMIGGIGTNANGQAIIDPKGSATRAQAATMLMRFLQKIEQE